MSWKMGNAGTGDFEDCKRILYSLRLPRAKMVNHNSCTLMCDCTFSNVVNCPGGGVVVVLLHKIIQCV